MKVHVELMKCINNQLTLHVQSTLAKAQRRPEASRTIKHTKSAGEKQGQITEN